MPVFVIIYFLLELYVSLALGERLGFIGSVVWILATLSIGMATLRMAPLTIMQNLQAVGLGKLDMKKFQDASMASFVGAILLVIPGVFSDLIGFGLMFYTFYLRFIATITPQKPNIYTNKGEEDVIDVEIVERNTDNNTSIECK
jgi:UPF0716 family protein affecting phage T7 exclusion